MIGLYHLYCLRNFGFWISDNVAFIQYAVVESNLLQLRYIVPHYIVRGYQYAGLGQLQQFSENHMSVCFRYWYSLLSIFGFSYVKHRLYVSLAKFKYFMMPMPGYSRRTDHKTKVVR